MGKKYLTYQELRQNDKSEKKSKWEEEKRKDVLMKYLQICFSSSSSGEAEMLSLKGQRREWRGTAERHRVLQSHSQQQDVQTPRVPVGKGRQHHVPVWHEHTADY